MKLDRFALYMCYVLAVIEAGECFDCIDLVIG